MKHYNRQIHRFLRHNHHFLHLYHLKALDELFHFEGIFDFYQFMQSYCFMEISLKQLVISFKYAGESNFGISDSYSTGFTSGLVFKEEYYQQITFQKLKQDLPSSSVFLDFPFPRNYFLVNLFRLPLLRYLYL